MSYIIGWSGQARSGKDSAADYLQERLNTTNHIISILGKWHRGSLGLAVKKIFAEHFGVTLEFIEEWKTKNEIPPGFNGPIRNGLTIIGDGWRNTKADIWLEKLFKEQSDKNLIISDVRYCNETEYIRSHNGVTILVWRPGHENDRPSKSEQELMPFVRQLQGSGDGVINNPLIPFDIWLKNDGTLEDWFKKIDQIVVPYIINKY